MHSIVRQKPSAIPPFPKHYSDAGCESDTPYATAKLEWPAQALCCQTVYSFVRQSATKLVKTIFWHRMNQFQCKLAQVVYGARAWNYKLLVIPFQYNFTAQVEASMKLIDAFPSPATVCRCWTGTFGGPWSQWVPNFGSTTFIYSRYFYMEPKRGP